MMNDDDQGRLARALSATAEVMGMVLKPASIALMVEDLSRHPIDRVLFALSQVRADRSSKFTLGNILERVDPGGGFLAANEAWTIALQAEDERNSVVWTEEIQKAWHVAEPAIASGDKVAARMAFIAAYERLSNESRMVGKRPYVFLSRGYDSSTNATAIQKALTAGLISDEHSDAMRRVSGAEMARIGGTGNGIAGLIEGIVEKAMSSEDSPIMQEKLRELIGLLKSDAKARDQARLAQQEQERREIDELRQRELDKLNKA